MTTFRRMTLAAAVLMVVGAACSDPVILTTTSAAPTTAVTTTRATPNTTAVTGDFIFGSGVLPEGIPDDFPIPAGATVASTLVNVVTGFTQAALVVPGETDDLAVFFDQNLEARGYDAAPAEQIANGRWRIEFTKDGFSGTVAIDPISAGLSNATITLPGA